MTILLIAFALSIPLGLDLYMPVPEDNPISVSKLELGRKLFHDRRLSRNRTMSCASCHDPARAFSDKRPLAVGVFGRVGKRHAPALINRGYGRSFFWDGRITSLEEQVLKPIQDPNEMDLTLDEASSRVGMSVPSDISGSCELHPQHPVRRLAVRPVHQRRPPCADSRPAAWDYRFSAGAATAPPVMWGRRSATSAFTTPV